MKMKTILLIVCAVAPLLLSGCNEKMERAKQQGITDRARAALAMELKMEELRFQTEIAIAETKSRLEQAMQKQFHKIAEPVFYFFTLAVCVSGITGLFLYQQDKRIKERMAYDYRMREEVILQNAAEKKYRLALEHVFGKNGNGGVFDRLSEEHKTMVLKRLDPPKVAKDDVKDKSNRTV